MNVPRLRFKDEDGREFPEWEDKTIDAVAEVTTGDKDTQNKIDDGAYPFFVRSQTVERINSYSFDGEAILTSGDGVGVGKNYHYINGKFDFHQRVYCLHSFKEGVNGMFIFHYFSEHFNKRVMQLSAKNSVDSVRRSMVTDMPINIPTYQEQTKIANFLTAIDEKITQLTQKYDLLKQYKKGVMQQIFSQKLRFKDKDGREFSGWEESPITDCLQLMTDFVANGSFESLKKNVVVYSENEYAYYVRLYDLRLGLGHSNQTYVDETSYKFLKKSFLKSGDILIANIGANAGEVWQVPLLDKPATIAPNMILLKVSKSTNESYLFYFLKSEYGEEEIKNTIGGSGQPKVSKTELKTVKVRIPASLPEQTKIANFLTAIDDKITQTQTQLEAVKLYKKGLLQQMFV